MEAKRKADEAERQRLAAVKAEQERQARAAAEAEAKRKADEAEQQRLAALRRRRTARRDRRPKMFKRPATAPAAAPTPAVAAATTWCGNPNALGVSRVIEIDTAGGPGFGFEHFKAYDFLRDHEIVLTFDDGPWPGHTPAVLKALAEQCTKAVFFPDRQACRLASGNHETGSSCWPHHRHTYLVA